MLKFLKLKQIHFINLLLKQYICFRGKKVKYVLGLYMVLHLPQILTGNISVLINSKGEITCKEKRDTLLNLPVICLGLIWADTA